MVSSRPDWCVSRQRSWGVPITIIKCNDCNELVSYLSDDQIRKLLRGGHDSRKVYAAYRAAAEHRGQPTVILAKTVKGYGLGEAGEGKNVTHQQKKLNEAELREFRARFGIPISDDEVGEAPFYRPPDDSPEMRYLRERRTSLGGFAPARTKEAPPIDPEVRGATGERSSLDRILSCARSAPSAGNLQYTIVVVEGRGSKQALARAALDQACVADAAAVLVFFHDPARSAAKYGQRGGELYSLQDATIACTYAQLLPVT